MRQLFGSDGLWTAVAIPWPREARSIAGFRAVNQRSKVMRRIYWTVWCSQEDSDFDCIAKYPGTLSRNFRALARPKYSFLPQRTVRSGLHARVKETEVPLNQLVRRMSCVPIILIAVRIPTARDARRYEYEMCSDQRRFCLQMQKSDPQNGAELRQI